MKKKWLSLINCNNSYGMKKLAETIKVLLWRLTKGNLIHIQYRKTAKERERMHNILTSEETVQYIIDHKCSVARFGDGEFQMIEHGMRGGDANSFGVDSFQQFDTKLSIRLSDVLAYQRKAVGERPDGAVRKG